MADRPKFGWPDYPPDASSGMLLAVDAPLADRLRRAAYAHDQPPEHLAADLLARAIEQEAVRLQAESALERLTPREREVIHFIALGRTNRQIAAALVVSPETVKTHVRHALEKLGVHSKAELRLRLSEMGLRQWPEPPDVQPHTRLPLDLSLPFR